MTNRKSTSFTRAEARGPMPTLAEEQPTRHAPIVGRPPRERPRPSGDDIGAPAAEKQEHKP